MYLLDTTVWIDLLRSNSRSIRHRLTAHSKSTIGLSIITLCELQYGPEKRAAQYPHLRAREQQLLSAIVAPFDVFLLDHDVVEVYGRVRAALENSGTAIGALDAFIAAQALSLGAVLVTSNEKEFQRVQGLQVENWGCTGPTANSLGAHLLHAFLGRPRLQYYLASRTAAPRGNNGSSRWSKTGRAPLHRNATNLRKMDQGMWLSRILTPTKNRSLSSLWQ